MGLQVTFDKGEVVWTIGDEQVGKLLRRDRPGMRTAIKKPAPDGQYKEIKATWGMLWGKDAITTVDEKSKDLPWERKFTDMERLFEAVNLDMTKPCTKDTHTLDVGVCMVQYWPVTVEQLQEKVNNAWKSWGTDPKLKEMTAILKNLRTRPEMPKITNIMALGLGSIHDASQKPFTTAVDQSASQLAAVMIIRKLLGDKGQPLPCAIQDPEYSQLEKTFYRSLGLEPLDDPDGFSRIDKGTLVFDVGTFMELKQRVSYGIRPAAVICEDCADPVSIMAVDHPLCCRQSVRAMFQHYQRELFVGFHEGHGWSPGTVYLYSRRIDAVRNVGDEVEVVS